VGIENKRRKIFFQDVFLNLLKPVGKFFFKYRDDIQYDLFVEILKSVIKFLSVDYSCIQGRKV